MDVLKFIHIVLVGLLIAAQSFSQKMVSSEYASGMEISKEIILDGSQTPPKIRDIHFESGNVDLTAEVKLELNHLIDTLKEDTILEVLVVTHTDSKGTKAYNMELSKKRGKEIKAYLIDNGISDNRIYIEAFGEEKLKNHCKDRTYCDEYLHKENRRAEFVLFKD